MTATKPCNTMIILHLWGLVTQRWRRPTWRDSAASAASSSLTKRLLPPLLASSPDKPTVRGLYCSSLPNTDDKCCRNDVPCYVCHEKCDYSKEMEFQFHHVTVCLKGLLQRGTTWAYHLYRAAGPVTPDPLVELLPALNNVAWTVQLPDKKTGIASPKNYELCCKLICLLNIIPSLHHFSYSSDVIKKKNIITKKSLNIPQRPLQTSLVQLAFQFQGCSTHCIQCLREGGTKNLLGQ